MVLSNTDLQQQNNSQRLLEKQQVKGAGQAVDIATFYQNQVQHLVQHQQQPASNQAANGDKGNNSKRYAAKKKTSAQP